MDSTIRVLADPLARLHEWLAGGAPRIIIGIAGLPGAGKSTLAAQLAQRLNAAVAAPCALALGMDGFHLSRAQLRQLPDPALAFARRGAPWTFDADGFVARLGRLRHHTAAVGWPTFAHDVGDPVADAVTVTPDIRLVLVEGLYLLHDRDGWQAAQPACDEVWYLDTPWDTAIERLTLRHMRAWSFSRAQAEARIAGSDGLNAALVRDSAVRAAWRVAG